MFETFSFFCSENFVLFDCLGIFFPNFFQDCAICVNFGNYSNITSDPFMKLLVRAVQIDVVTVVCVCCQSL